jgi:hypothetical protein
VDERASGYELEGNEAAGWIVYFGSIKLADLLISDLRIVVPHFCHRERVKERFLEVVAIGLAEVPLRGIWT